MHPVAPGPVPYPAAPAPAPAPDLDLSVVIVAYRSRADLEACLPTLVPQLGSRDEVLVVNNSPDDGLSAWLASAWPGVRAVDDPSNPGYAGGNHLGVRLARGRRALLLNPDTRLEPGALASLRRTADAAPDALVGAKLLRPDGRVNAVGLEMHYTGIATCRALGDDPGAHRGVVEVPLLSGAALLGDRDALIGLGPFEREFFMYMEDVDLSLRARRAGLRLLVDADATIWHDYVPALTAGKFYHLERNRRAVLHRTFEPRTLRRLGAGLALTGAATWAFALLRGPAFVRARARAGRDARRGAGRWRASRLPGDDAPLLADARIGLPFDQLMGSPGPARLLDRLTRPLYALAAPRTRGGAEGAR